MSTVAGIMETEDVVGKPTLVRRVSNMLKDGSCSGPPMLFRHASMQKIRHCCQNLNLFPYLLYSFDNSKHHPIARKVHLCFAQLFQVVTVRVLFIYNSYRQTLLHGIHPEDCQAQPESSDIDGPCKQPKFRTFVREKRKQSTLFLTLAVYFAPLLIAFQVIGLFGLMVFGKYTPGFIFLISALLFLGCIWMKILFHETTASTRIKPDKIKVQ